MASRAFVTEALLKGRTVYCVLARGFTNRDKPRNPLTMSDGTECFDWYYNEEAARKARDRFNRR